VLPADLLEDALRRRDDLLADAVAGDDRDPVGSHGRTLRGGRDELDAGSSHPSMEA
jgi:hypothetical protein